LMFCIVRNGIKSAVWCMFHDSVSIPGIFCWRVQWNSKEVLHT
jgi:hypothetical protein